MPSKSFFIRSLWPWPWILWPQNPTSTSTIYQGFVHNEAFWKQHCLYSYNPSNFPVNLCQQLVWKWFCFFKWYYFLCTHNTVILLWPRGSLIIHKAVVPNIQLVSHVFAIQCTDYQNTNTTYHKMTVTNFTSLICQIHIQTLTPNPFLWFLLGNIFIDRSINWYLTLPSIGFLKNW